MAKRKTCKGVCGKQYALAKFPNSATSKDGKLGYCRLCWSGRMKKARKKGSSKADSEEETTEVEAPKRAYNKAKKSPSNGLGLFNQALNAANGSKEIWEVIADDGERKEYRGATARKRAYKQSLLWMMDGYDCTLREIHEFRPKLQLEIVS